MIEKCLTLNNGHVDPSKVIETSDEDSGVLEFLGFSETVRLDSGGLRSASHEYGWVVFVYPDCPDVPEWLEDIHDHAVANDCTLILFDRDGDESELFKKYDW